MRCKSRFASRPGVALVAATVFLAGCNTNADVAVDVAKDGSGTVAVAVELDSEASSAIGGAEGLVLTDLAETGWALSGPEAAEDGSLKVSATHDFAGDDELAAVLDGVAGPGVFTDVSIDIEESFGSTEWSASLNVEVSGDPAQFSDEELTAVLGGLPLGRTPEELAEVGATVPGAATMSVGLSMFGQDSDAAELDLTAGEPSSASLSVQYNETQTLVYVLAAFVAVLLLAAVVFAVLALRRRRS
ncbi:MAG: hypothetical protein ACR2OH_08305 [Microthrixaceae bacterium]